jgi:hypothetical protein
MVAKARSYLWGNLPKALISLNLGIVSSIIGLFALLNLILYPLNFSNEISQEVQLKVSRLLIWLVTGFCLGMISWMVGFVAFPADKKHPRWRTCRVCSSIGISLGILAILIYLFVLMFLPVPAYIPFLK